MCKLLFKWYLSLVGNSLIILHVGNEVGGVVIEIKTLNSTTLEYKSPDTSTSVFIKQ